MTLKLSSATSKNQNLTPKEMDAFHWVRRIIIIVD